MAPKLYAADLSPAVRSVLLLVEAIGLEIEIVPVNLAAGEQMKPEYLKVGSCFVSTWAFTGYRCGHSKNSCTGRLEEPNKLVLVVRSL